MSYSLTSTALLMPPCNWKALVVAAVSYSAKSLKDTMNMPEKNSHKARKIARQRKNPLSLVLLGIGGFLLFLLAVLLLTQQFTSATPTAAPSPALDTRSVPRVGLPEAYPAFENGQAIFLDVRSVEAFQLLRITGAVNIPEYELTSRLTELNKNDWIIPYCT